MVLVFVPMKIFTVFVKADGDTGFRSVKVKADTHEILANGLVKFTAGGKIVALFVPPHFMGLIENDNLG